MPREFGQTHARAFRAQRRRAVALDASGKMAGRGAYVCADEACFAKACEKRLFGGRLRTKAGNDDYERLRADFDAYMRTSSAASAGDR